MNWKFTEFVTYIIFHFFHIYVSIILEITFIFFLNVCQMIILKI